jgi:hypothetical protein
MSNLCFVLAKQSGEDGKETSRRWLYGAQELRNESSKLLQKYATVKEIFGHGAGMKLKAKM